MTFSNPFVGCVDSVGVFYCPGCLHPADSCGLVYALDLTIGDSVVSLCAECGKDVLDRDDLRGLL